MYHRRNDKGETNINEEEERIIQRRMDTKSNGLEGMNLRRMETTINILNVEAEYKGEIVLERGFIKGVIREIGAGIQGKSRRQKAA